MCKSTFARYSDMDRIYSFTSPRVHKLFDILKRFQPTAGEM